MKNAKKTLFKLVAMLLAVVLCTACLAGCVQNDTEGTKPSVSGNTTGKKNVEIYPLESDKTFKVLTTGTERGETIITQKMEEATGVEIDYSYLTWEQLSMTLGAGDFPDAIFMAFGGLTKVESYEYGQAGKLVNFMDYLDIMPNFSALIEANPEVLKYAQNEDGSVYMLPSLSRTATGQNNLIYYRTDMMEAVGWKNPPKTTDEFVEYIKDLQEHYGATDPDFIAFNGYRPNSMSWLQVRMMNYFFASFGELLQTGFTVNSKDEVVLGAATEQYKHLLEFMHEVWESGAFNTNIYSQDLTASKALSAGNHVGVVTEGTGLTGDNFASGTLELAVLEPLTSEYWDTPHWYQTSAMNFATVNAISTTCQDIETMVQWFDAWYAPADNPLNEEGTMFAILPWLGEVGEDVSFNEETQEYKELPHDGIETGTFTATQGWTASLYSGFEGGSFPYVQDKNTTLGVKGLGTINQLWPYAELTFNLGDLALTEDEQDIYADIYTDIETYITDATAKFISGQVDIKSGWAEYLNNLEKMNLDDLIDMYQAAYDRYQGK